MSLVVASWKQVQAIEDYQDVAGEMLFRKIFEIAPEAQDLFKFGRIDSENFNKKSFMRHARGVISTVDAAIDLLQKEDMETLINVLKDLGARHAKYSVKEEHFPVVGEALLYTLGQALADDFTPDVKEGWVAVYGVITQHMTDGLLTA